MCAGLDIIRTLLQETYAKKPQLVEANMKAIQLGYDYARAHFACPLPLRVEKMDATRGHIVIDATPRPHSAASMPAPRWARGIRSRPRPR